MENLSQIQQFYCRKNVLITGATGFLGKLLIEKLLRRCSGIQQLYLVVRDKKGKDIHTRFNDTLKDPVFDRLKKEVPEFRQKIILMAGDCSKPDLGLSAIDQEIMFEKVNVIFHLAATVRFNERLRTALDVNVRATVDLLHLARNMTNLEVFMYMSTAYSNVLLQLIEEKIYNSVQERIQLKLIENQTDLEIEKNIQKILGPWPNTYTFSKALAEEQIASYCKEMPIGIFRPAIVISTANEPMKGWIDNLYGPTGSAVAIGAGVLRSVNVDGNAATDLVPGDYTVNCLIAATLDVHRAYSVSPAPLEPLIYNYVSSVENRINWREFATYGMEDLENYPLLNAVWYRSVKLNKYAVVHSIYNVLLHVVPAIIVDLVCLLLFKKPWMLRLQKKIQKSSSAVTYFATREIKFCNKRTRELWRGCSDVDKQIFPFSMAELSWREYFTGYSLGVKRYLLKEKDEQLAQTKRKLVEEEENVNYCWLINKYKPRPVVAPITRDPHQT